MEEIAQLLKEINYILSSTDKDLYNIYTKDYIKNIEQKNHLIEEQLLEVRKKLEEILPSVFKEKE